MVGILAAGVLAAIFGVIPFSQDHGAKQDLSSIRTAEGVAKAKDGRFMDHSRLLDIGYLHESSTKSTKVKSDEKGTCYVGLAKSGTGTVFFSTDRDTDPQILTVETQTGCITRDQLDTLIEEVGGVEEDGEKGPDKPSTPEPGTGNDQPSNSALYFKLEVKSSLQAIANWGRLAEATGYRVEYQLDGGPLVVKNMHSDVHYIYINALPTQHISAKVYPVVAGKQFEPSTDELTLPDTVLKNPSFEEGVLYWSAGSTIAGSTSKTAHTGAKSVNFDMSNPAFTSNVAQTVSIPAETPVVTYWSDSGGHYPVVTLDEKFWMPAAIPTGQVEDGWKQYKSDLSMFSGKLVTLRFSSTKGSLDDIALVAPMEPSAPAEASATSKLNSATVTWKEPVFNGGASIRSYTVDAISGGEKVGTVAVDGSMTTATIPGLQAGKNHIFRVTAHNSAGASAPKETGAVPINAGPIANPGFEQGDEGWTSLWTGMTSTEKAHTGDRSMKFGKDIFGKGKTAAQRMTVTSDSSTMRYWTTTGTLNVSVNDGGGFEVPGTCPGGSCGRWMDSPLGRSVGLRR